MTNHTLKLSTIRNYYTMWKSVKGDTRYNEIFNNKHRIYINLEQSNSISAIQNEVTKELEKIKYIITDYQIGLAKKDNSKNNYKIGKLLQKINPTLKNSFDSDVTREGTKINKTGMKIVISRHPLDIMTMSTGRSWSSCMNINSGCNKNYVAHDIKEGSIIAYLIREDDLNIKKPIARVLLKPFSKETAPLISELMNSSKPYGVEITTCFSLDGRIYGTPIKGFSETIEKWLDRFQTYKKGVYHLNKNLYPNGKRAILIGYGKKYSLNKTVKNYSIVGFNHNYGLINKNGDVIIDTIYKNVTIERNEDDIYFFRFKDNNKQGCIILSDDGILRTIEPIYSDIRSILKDKLLIYNDNKYGMMDIEGNVILNVIYNSIFILPQQILVINNSSIYDVENNKFLFKFNKPISNPVLLSKNPFLLQIGWKKILNDKGEVVFNSNENDIITYLDNSNIRIRRNGLYALYNIEKQKYLTDFIYYNIEKTKILEDGTYQTIKVIDNKYVYATIDSNGVENEYNKQNS